MGGSRELQGEGLFGFFCLGGLWKCFRGFGAWEPASWMQ